MKSWVVKVCNPGLAPFWLGSFNVVSRAQAKRIAVGFVAAHLPSTCKIICIAEGVMTLTLTGPEIPFE